MEGYSCDDLHYCAIDVHNTLMNSLIARDVNVDTCQRFLNGCALNIKISMIVQAPNIDEA